MTFESSELTDVLTVPDSELSLMWHNRKIHSELAWACAGHLIVLVGLIYLLTARVASNLRRSLSPQLSDFLRTETVL